MDLVTRINRLLDAIPRREVRIGTRVLSPYTIFAVAGLGVGSLLLLVLAAVTGRPLALALAWPPVILATFVVVGLVGRAARGVETHAVLEVWLASVAVVAAVLWAVGGDVLDWLDILAVAAAGGVAVGRIGCASHGCCYGVPCELGFCYPDSAPAGPGRRFPVQLVEAALWTGLAATGAVLVFAGAPGRAVALILAGYGAARLCLGSLRGGAPRRWLGLDWGRWLSLVALAAGVGLDLVLHPVTPGGAAVLALGGLCAVILVAARRLWMDAAPALRAEDAEALRAFGGRLRTTAPQARVEELRLGAHRTTATWLRQADATWLMVTLESDGSPLSDGVARVAFAAIADGLGAFGGEPEVYTGAPDRASAQFLLESMEADDGAGAGWAA